MGQDVLLTHMDDDVYLDFTGPDGNNYSVILTYCLFLKEAYRPGQYIFILRPGPLLKYSCSHNPEVFILSADFLNSPVPLWLYINFYVS